MYEAPKLTRVGEVEEVVLGVIGTGGDIDLMWNSGDMEFAEEVPED